MFLCSVALLVFDQAQGCTTLGSLDRGNIAVSGIWVWRYATLDASVYEHYTSVMWVSRFVLGLAFGNSS